MLKLKPAAPRKFPVASFGDVGSLQVGDRVLALGSPLALSQSVTMGIVSNTEMIMPGMFWPFNRMTLDGEDVGSIVRWIGHDAAIFGGNSGGPLVNMKGEIVGVNEISLGLAGAIPADLAREVAEALMRDGRVRRAWLGLEVQPLLSSSKATRGALVGGTIDGSPAAAAGFLSGDIIVKLAGRDVTVRFAEEVPIFNQVVMRLPIGKPVEAVVLRHGAEKTISVTPTERESVDARVRELPLLGITASNLTSWAAKELKRSSRDGVRVRGIRPGGPSDEAKPSLRDDDVIVSVDGKAIGSFEALEKTIETLTHGKDERVPALVGFERAGERLLDGDRRRPRRARGSRARGPQGLGAGVGAGADARAGRTLGAVDRDRRARHPRLRRVGAGGRPARRRHRRRARRQCPRSLAAVATPSSSRR